MSCRSRVLPLRFPQPVKVAHQQLQRGTDLVIVAEPSGLWRVVGVGTIALPLYLTLFLLVMLGLGLVLDVLCHCPLLSWTLVLVPINVAASTLFLSPSPLHQFIFTF